MLTCLSGGLDRLAVSIIGAVHITRAPPTGFPCNSNSPLNRLARPMSTGSVAIDGKRSAAFCPGRAESVRSTTNDPHGVFCSSFRCRGIRLRHDPSLSPSPSGLLLHIPVEENRRGPPSAGSRCLRGAMPGNPQFCRYRLRSRSRTRRCSRRSAGVLTESRSSEPMP